MSAALFQARRAGWKIQFVVDDQEVFNIDLVVIQQRPDGLTAVVHEHRWPRQDAVPSENLRPANLRRQPRLLPEPQAGVAGLHLTEQPVQKPKPGIVPGLAVLASRITETDYQEKFRQTQLP